MKQLFIFIVSFCVLCVTAGVSPVHGDQTIEIGGGATSTEQEVDVLLRVNAGITGPSDFVLVKVTGDFAAGASGLTYADFHLVGLGISGGNEYIHAGVNFLNVDIQRDIFLDNSVMGRVNVLGVYGEATAPLTHDINLIANAAIDFLGVGFATRRSDGQSIGGIGANFGGSAQLGIDYQKKYRVVFGAKFSSTTGETKSEPTGTYTCHDYAVTHYDDWGNEYTTYERECDENTRIIYSQDALASQAYVEASAQLNDHLSLFGKASYNVFELTDGNGPLSQFVDSHGNNWRFMLGIQYKL